MKKKMQLPCSVCGTILQVQPDTEYIYCTMCGTRVELGVHSYRTEDDAKKGVYCISCDQRLNPDAIGTIFSCDNCNQHVCSICGKLSNNKHYCPACYEKLNLEPGKSKKGKVSKKPSKLGKRRTKAKPKAKKKQPKKSKISKKKTSTLKSKPKGNSKVKTQKKGKGKSKPKGKVKQMNSTII